MNKIFFTLMIAFSIIMTSYASNTIEAEEQLLKNYLTSPLNINLMWLAPVTKPLEEYVFTNPPTTRSNALNALQSWGQKNPEENTSITFWYNSRSVSTSAVNSSIEYLKDKIDPAIFSRIKLSSIQTLKSVTDYPNFFKENIPIYFQTDILRFMILYDLLPDNAQHTFVYADLNVTAQSRQELFDSQTINFLNDFGIVFMRHRFEDCAWGGWNGFENKFMMAVHNESIIKSIKHALLEPLDVTILRVKSYQNSSYKKLEQIVYDGILIFCTHLFHDLGKINISNISSISSKEIIKVGGREIRWNKEIYNILDPDNDQPILINYLDERTIYFNCYNNPDEQQFITELREEDPKAYDTRFKREIKWPKNLPIPVKTMIAPRSHF